MDRREGGREGNGWIVERRRREKSQRVLRTRVYTEANPIATRRVSSVDDEENDETTDSGTSREKEKPDPWTVRYPGYATLRFRRLVVSLAEFRSAYDDFLLGVCSCLCCPSSSDSLSPSLSFAQTYLVETP